MMPYPTGGIQLHAVDENFQLKKKQQYCIGEMLDWDAPTGGYLLQACFSMGISCTSLEQHSLNLMDYSLILYFDCKMTF
jgi:predicted flavoprotein YhiN